MSRFELFELILLLELDKRFSIEQFQATVSQSAVPSPPLRLAGLVSEFVAGRTCKHQVGERGSAPRRGRHSTIVVPVECICAVAAWWFDRPRQRVVPRSRIPRSTSHFSHGMAFSSSSAQPLEALRRPGMPSDADPGMPSDAGLTFHNPQCGSGRTDAETRDFEAPISRRVPRSDDFAPRPIGHSAMPRVGERGSAPKGGVITII